MVQDAPCPCGCVQSGRDSSLIGVILAAIGLADIGDGTNKGSQGVFVVLHGIVRSAYVAADGTASVRLVI